VTWVAPLCLTHPGCHSETPAEKNQLRAGLSKLEELGSVLDETITSEFLELGQADFQDVVSLRDEVLLTLPDPDCYVPGPDEDAVVEVHLGRAGVTFGARIGRRLVAYAALSLDIHGARLDPEFYQAVVARCDAVERCAVLACTMVHAEFRGRHLHQQAIRRRLQHARARGRTEIIAMVSPRNAPCLHNLTGHGLKVVDLIKFADGRQRYFLRGKTP
jgi:GNAT superfamily N-acetyltransferase